MNEYYSYSATCPCCGGSGIAKDCACKYAKCSNCNGEGVVYYKDPQSFTTGNLFVILNNEH